MNKVGCIIGRFQPLHDGHKLLIETSLQKNTHTIIFVGSAQTQNSDNPYDFETREKIINNNFKNSDIKIIALPDFESDELWLEYILNKLPATISRLQFYCGDELNDSAIVSIKKLKNKLTFEFNIIEIPRSIIPITATQVRKAFKNNNNIFLKKYLSKETITIIKNIG